MTDVAPSPLLVVAVHGILTGRTTASWPERFRCWCMGERPHWRVITAWYHELPLPWLAAWRNRRRVRLLVELVEMHRTAMLRERAMLPAVALVGHSNGCAIVADLVDALAARGIQVSATVLTGAALPADSTAKRALPWPGRVTAWCCETDPALSLLRWLPRVFAGAWGTLGLTGWAGDGPQWRSLHQAARPVCIAPACRGALSGPCPCHLLHERWFSTGHGGYFRPAAAHRFFPLLAADLEPPAPLHRPSATAP